MFPILVLPVKEIKGNRVSLAMALPTSAPPQTRLHIPPGRLFCSRTLAMILVVATLHRGVDGADFQIMEFPQTYNTHQAKKKSFHNILDSFQAQKGTSKPTLEFHQ